MLDAGRVRPFCSVTFRRRRRGREARMVLVQLSVVEQRLDAVRAVLAGATATEGGGLCRGVPAVCAYLDRPLCGRWVGGPGGPFPPPASCPHQVSTVVEIKVAEMRREHPRWGSKRIRMELLRKPVAGVVVPSTATINRILTRPGLVQPRPRKRPRDAYVRWERPRPMQLWGNTPRAGRCAWRSRRRWSGSGCPRRS